eukprot:8486206-Pyramimonas_sp.AAC.1
MEVQDKTAYWAAFKAALQKHHRDTAEAALYNLVDEQLSLYSCSLADFGIAPPDATATQTPAARAAQ